MCSTAYVFQVQTIDQFMVPVQQMSCIQSFWGMFKYTRLIFYEMVGPTSEKSKQIDALAKIHCREFTRRSDRSLPNTNFSKGIRGGGKLWQMSIGGYYL
jgi:hypothetical protein